MTRTQKTTTEKALPTFDLSGSASQVADRWRKWKRAFQYYADGKDIKGAHRKTSQLLHLAGLQLQDIYEDLRDPGPETETDDEYKVCIRKLDHYFKAEDNVPYERHLFRQLAPKEGESADQFMVRLKQQARRCSFGDSLEDNLRDQLIEKLGDLELKKRMLETSNITLEEALKKARVWEAAGEQARQMTIPAEGTEANLVRSSSGQGRKSNACFNCGKEGHFARDQSCPARGKKCGNCGKHGHFAACCRADKDVHESKKQSTSQRRGFNRDRRAHGKQANYVEDDQSSEEDAFAFSVTEQACTVSASSQPLASVSIGGVTKEVLIDSGSVSNLMGEEIFQELTCLGLKSELQHCTKKLYAYGGQELEVVGQFHVEISVAKARVKAIFVVVKKGRCLLGYSTAKDLGVLRIGPGAGANFSAADCSHVGDTFAEKIKVKHPKVFQGIGKLKDYKLKLHIDETAIPVAQKVRRVPFSLRSKVTDKVNELLEMDIIERVDGPTTWVSPVVVAAKPSGEIRLCVDMRRANEAIIRERLPIPTIDETLESLNGSTVFSKLDLRWGFHQIELEDDSRDITTFATHDGIFRYKRLSFGVNAAPEKYQHIISQAMAGLGGVSNIADDLIVHGKDTEEHNRNLDKVLERLEEKQLTLNAGKCIFGMEKVVFMGILLTKHGIGPTKEKVRAVVEASQPTTPSEVRSFLGLVGFSARFIPNFSTIAEPLRKIARKGTPFVWSGDQAKAFEKLKEQIASAPVLAYFDKEAHIQVIADASPVGLGAVLVQEKNGESRAVCYASRTLSSVERRYSQTEKEALALVWACERFHLYLYGLAKFDLVTDHEALKVIYSRTSKPSARIERWVLRLQPYNYHVIYVPSRRNIADALSRLTKAPASRQSQYDDEYIRMVALHAVPLALRIQEIEQASSKDGELQAIRECLVNERWENLPTPYLPMRNELTFIGHVVLRGTRIIVPQVLRKRVIELAHEGHQGIVKTKERLRSKVWWPGIDREADKKCRECFGCQLVTKNISSPPVKPTQMPQLPWEELALDLLGPMPSGEYLLVLVDYFSRWLEVDVIRSTSSETIIKRLDAHFARHGMPRSLKTDNAPNLASKEVDDYLREMGIEHRKTTPFWPRANGEVERQNRSLLKAMRAAAAEGRNWHAEMNKFLLAYRSTPHSTTGKSPAELLFRRKLKTKLPDLSDVGEEEEVEVSHQSVRDRDAEKKQANKDYVDGKYHAQDRDVRVGESVLLEKKRDNKLSASYEKAPYQVTARHGDQVVLQSPQGVRYKRNLQHVKRFLVPDQEEHLPSIQELPTPAEQPPEYLPSLQEQPVSVRPPTEPAISEDTPLPELRRSGRVRRPPKALDDYVLK